MAITDLQISDTLETSAPSIKYTGNEGPQAPQQMASMEAGQEGTLEDIYFELLGEGFSPEEAAKRAREFYNDMSSQAPQQNSGIMAAAPGTYSQRRKQMMAYGGVAGADGRKKYGIGSIFQKYIKDPLEVAFTGKSFADLERESQARVDEEDRLYGEGYQNPFDTFLKGAPQQKANELVNQYLGTGDQYDVLNMFGLGANDTSGEDPGRLPLFSNFLGLGVEGLKPYLKYRQTIKDPVAAVPSRTESRQVGPDIRDVVIPGTPAQPGEYRQTEKVNPLYPIAAGLGVGKYVSGLPKDTLPADTTSINPAAIAAAARGTDAEGAAEGLRFLPEQVTRAAEGGRIGYAKGSKKRTGIMKMLADLEERFPELMMYGSMGAGSILPFLKEGGRVPAQEGGLMDMGGMEKDYREEGGFVPIGGKEKADDVPARLSKNEFVFTADAVRGAGGGDIDKGAEIMENVMKNLEQGGQISEESQGLGGAQEMFDVSERLSEVV